jgi:hypothetical protein
MNTMRNTIKNEIIRNKISREEFDALDPWSQIEKSLIVLKEEDRVEDSDSIEEDCWSYRSDCHYTKTVGYWYSLSVTAHVRTVFHLPSVVECYEHCKDEFSDPKQWEHYCIMDALSNISGEGDTPDWITEYESDYENLVAQSCKVVKIRRLADGYVMVQAIIEIATGEEDGSNYKSIQDIKNEALEARADYILDMRKEPTSAELDRAQDAYERQIYGD